MHHNVFTIVAALAAACVFCWLAILNFRGDFKNPQSQATHVSTPILGYLYSGFLLLCAFTAVGWVVFGRDPCKPVAAWQSEPTVILVDSQTQQALEHVLKPRYVDPLSLEIIEQWLNAYVRTKPSFHSGVILSVDIQKPKQVLQKISAGNDLSDQERIKLLEWAAFELNTRVDPEVELLSKRSLSANNSMQPTGSA